MVKRLTYSRFLRFSRISCNIRGKAITLRCYYILFDSYIHLINYINISFLRFSGGPLWLFEISTPTLYRYNMDGNCKTIVRQCAKNVKQTTFLLLFFFFSSLSPSFSSSSSLFLSLISSLLYFSYFSGRYANDTHIIEKRRKRERLSFGFFCRRTLYSLDK